MAILLRGHSKCPLFGKVIENVHEVVLFPHFILNENDSLFALSDSACHACCVKEDPRGLAMLAVAGEYYDSTGPGKRACVVRGNQVRMTIC
jgi:hypothetical protein